MADVDIQIGGHAYTLSCAAGEEADLRRLAAVVDAEVSKARTMIGGMTEIRQLLFAAIFLAERAASSDQRDGAHLQFNPQSLIALTDRIERVGNRLAELCAQADSRA